MTRISAREPGRSGWAWAHAKFGLVGEKGYGGMDETTFGSGGVELNSAFSGGADAMEVVVLECVIGGDAGDRDEAESLSG